MQTNRKAATVKTTFKLPSAVWSSSSMVGRSFCFATDMSCCAFSTEVLRPHVYVLFWNRSMKYRPLPGVIIGRVEHICIPLSGSSCKRSKAWYSTRHYHVISQRLPSNVFKSHGRLGSTCWIVPWRRTDPHTSPSEVRRCDSSDD